MAIWDQFVGVLVMVLFALAQAYGGNVGLAIVTLSLSVRLMLLPITIRLARRAEVRQAKLRGLQPKVRWMTAKYRSDPRRLNTELLKLYRKHGLSGLDLKDSLGGLVQLPVGAGLYTAIGRGVAEGGRFLWIANLAKPDVLLVLLIGVLTYATSLFAPSLPHQARLIIPLIPSLLAVGLAWNLASGVGLYWAASTAVGGLQYLIVRRTAK